MKKIYWMSFFLLSLFWISASQALGQVKCIDASGESIILSNDLPSARLEAVARAKWTAIEQVVGTEVKAGSFVQNFTLVEDVIKTKAGGVVKNYKVLSENVKDDILAVKINACVEPTRARDAVSQLGLNNAIALFIPARKPGRMGDEFEETNILSETLIAKMLEQGYTVTDVTPTHAVDAKEIEKAMRSGNTMALRSLMYKFLSNLSIIGKVDYTISTKKGEDIGYGLSMPFNNVTVRLTYRILAKNKAGNMDILSAGVEEARALANSAEDAAAKAMKELAEKLAPALLDKVSQYIKGNTRKVTVEIAGIKDLETVLKVKALLQNIVWVSDVEEKQMGSYIVSYPENTLYLANSINQKGNFKLKNFSPYSLSFEYLEPH
jgi:hypothetical protein